MTFKKLWTTAYVQRSFKETDQDCSKYLSSLCIWNVYNFLKFICWSWKGPFWSRINFQNSEFTLSLCIWLQLWFLQRQHVWLWFGFRDIWFLIDCCNELNCWLQQQYVQICHWQNCSWCSLPLRKLLYRSKLISRLCRYTYCTSGWSNLWTTGF